MLDLAGRPVRPAPFLHRESVARIVHAAVPPGAFPAQAMGCSPRDAIAFFDDIASMPASRKCVFVDAAASEMTSCNCTGEACLEMPCLPFAASPGHGHGGMPEIFLPVPGCGFG